MPISTCDAGALILVTDLHLSIQRTLTLTNKMTELKVEWDWDRSFLGEDFVCLFVCLFAWILRHSSVFAQKVCYLAYKYRSRNPVPLSIIRNI